MTQAERDRLGALKKAKKKLITQREAAEEIGITERQVRRLLRKMKQKGDKVVIHALRGQPSKRKLATEERAIQILSQPIYQGFGPTPINELAVSRASTFGEAIDSLITDMRCGVYAKWKGEHYPHAIIRFFDHGSRERRGSRGDSHTPDVLSVRRSWRRLSSNVR